MQPREEYLCNPRRDITNHARSLAAFDAAAQSEPGADFAFAAAVSVFLLMLLFLFSLFHTACALWWWWRWSESVRRYQREPVSIE